MPKSAKLRSADRREHILEVAMALFAERGVLHVSTRDIAAAVGISQPSLYAHFRSRDDIATEISQRAFRLLRERMEGLETAALAPAERLRLMGREYVRFGLENSAAYRVAFMVERARLAPEESIAIHEAGQRCFALLHDLFRATRQADDDHTAARAQSAWASMHGLVSLFLARPQFPWVDQDMLIELHLDRLCHNAFA